MKNMIPNYSKVYLDNVIFIVFGWLKEPIEPSLKISSDSKWATSIARKNLEDAAISNRRIILNNKSRAYSLMVARRGLGTGHGYHRLDEQLTLRKLYRVDGNGKVLCTRLEPSYNEDERRYYWECTSISYQGELSDVQGQIARELLGPSTDVIEKPENLLFVRIKDFANKIDL